jgi:DNA-binding transcriptional regulator LsrR (DeoR family)
MPRDPATLLAAARLYYLEGQSQADIATRMGTSRSNVSRMLTEAQKQGIVEIRINDPCRSRR